MTSRKTPLYILLAAVALFFVSCSDKIMGYSVVLWNNTENNLRSGEIVPVYIKSNISHVYVIGTQDGQKVEIPLWQLTEPVKKGKVKNVQAKYADCAKTYASVKTDGLPSRAEPVNTAKQIYRCRKGEIIKILYKGKGQPPMTGGKPLEGDWYRILTDDGTQGWCFSYNLNLYDVIGSDVTSGAFAEETEEEDDTAYQTVLSKVWYPDYFRTMIDSNTIDLTMLHPSYKFSIDEENKKVSLNTAAIHQVWDYEGYSKSDDYEYTLKNVPIIIVYKNSGFIVLRYTDESGKPQDLDFVSISDNIEEIVAAEKDRRSNAYMQIWAHGPVFQSDSYGKIELNEDGSFRWSSFKLLVPSVIPAGTKNVGVASVKYSLSKSLSESYDGVLTFKFDGVADDINFLYKIEDGGLRMEDTVGAEYKGNQIISRGTSPVRIFFKRISKDLKFEKN